MGNPVSDTVRGFGVSPLSLEIKLDLEKEILQKGHCINNVYCYVVYLLISDNNKFVHIVFYHFFT